MVTVVRVWAVVLAATSLVLAALPLVGLLGYESSFVLAIVASLAAAQVAGVAPAAARRAMAEAGDATESAAHASGGTSPTPWRLTASLWARSSLRALGLVVAPLVVLLANALRVKNCALVEGLGWFALLPVVSVVIGAAAGTVAGLATGTRRAGAVVGTLIVLGLIVWGVVRFYGAPPVFAYDPFAGFFSGSLYDEAITIEPALLGARLLHLGGALAFVLCAAALLDSRRLRLSLSALRLRDRRGLLITALVAVALFATAHRLTRPRFAPTASDIAEALGGRRDTEHLTILYNRLGPAGAQMDFFARDAELRWSQLRTRLGGAPEGKITIFLFDSAEDKRRWQGAAHVQVAKPWRREVYVQWERPPHTVLQHELAHVFAGRFGDALFGVARRGLAFNVGLIEGVAVAVGESASAGTPLLDQQVKAMRELGLEPRLDGVFGLGFLGEAPARAYTVAGSFVRFLLEKYGPEPLGRVFHEAGSAASWSAAYGVPFAELASEWSRRIDATPLGERERTVINERMRRPGILHRVCAHRLAQQREEARWLAGRGDHAAALAVLSSVCADDPDDPDPQLARLEEQTALAAMDKATNTAAALPSIDPILDHAKATDAQRARALLLRGDALLRGAVANGAAGIDGSGAEALYRQALALKLDDDTTRQIQARLLVWSALPADQPLRLPLARYLVGDDPSRDATLDLWRAQLVVDAAPERAIGHYLLGRMLLNRDRFADAAGAFDRALELGLPEGGFEPVARRWAAVAAFRAGDLAGARRRFQAIVTASGGNPSTEAAAREAADWIERVDFFDTSGKAR